MDNGGEMFGQKPRSKVLVISLIVVLLLVTGAGVFWYFKILKNNQTSSEITSNNNSISQPTPQPTTQETSETATQTDKFSKKVFFIHHSTGEIYWNGGMANALSNAGYEAAAPWWDANTDPGDFYPDFSDPNQWQILEPYSIIIFKSCFPASDITSDEMLAEYKTNYNKLYEIYRAHTDKLFVPLSTPPLLKNHTTAEAAQRALAFESWLVGDYKTSYDGKNLAPFKLHSLLSDPEGYLKAEFISSEEDDHPNAHSGEVVGSAIAKHLESWVK